MMMLETWKSTTCSIVLHAYPNYFKVRKGKGEMWLYCNLKKQKKLCLLT